jgi:hypothetical protein
MPIGCIAGFIVPATIISEEDQANVEVGMQKFCNYLLIQNCVVTIVTIPFIIFVREKPLTPPSAAAS